MKIADDGFMDKPAKLTRLGVSRGSMGWIATVPAQRRAVAIASNT